MTSTKMTPDQAHEFYAKPENRSGEGQEGAFRKTSVRLSDPVPVRFPLDMLEEIRTAADRDGRSVSNWIRQAVKRQLEVERSS